MAKQDVIKWFKERIYEKIDLSTYFFESDIEDFKDLKQKKFIKKAYNNDKFKALEWANLLNKQEQKYIKHLIGNYTCDSMRYFIRFLEEGEVSSGIGRINFDLIAVNDMTDEKIKLISSDENDDIYNDFEGLVLDKCVETEEDNN